MWTFLNKFLFSRWNVRYCHYWNAERGCNVLCKGYIMYHVYSVIHNIGWSLIHYVNTKYRICDDQNWPHSRRVNKILTACVELDVKFYSFHAIARVRASLFPAYAVFYCSNSRLACFKQLDYLNETFKCGTFR